MGPLADSLPSPDFKLVGAARGPPLRLQFKFTLVGGGGIERSLRASEGPLADSLLPIGVCRGCWNAHSGTVTLAGRLGRAAAAGGGAGGSLGRCGRRAHSAGPGPGPKSTTAGRQRAAGVLGPACSPGAGWQA